MDIVRKYTKSDNALYCTVYLHAFPVVKLTFHPDGEFYASVLDSRRCNGAFFSDEIRRFTLYGMKFFDSFATSSRFSQSEDLF